MNNEWLGQVETQRVGVAFAESAKDYLDRLLAACAESSDYNVRALATNYDAVVQCAQALGFTIEHSIVRWTAEEQEDNGREGNQEFSG